MSYIQGTILRRKEPFGEPDSGTPDLQPYNEIEVVGPSPVQTNVRAEEWSGQQGDNYTIKPTSFGEALDRPAGELERDYTVEKIPDVERDLKHTVEVVQPGPSPEETFRKTEISSKKPKSVTRERTPLANEPQKQPAKQEDSEA